MDSSQEHFLTLGQEGRNFSISSDAFQLARINKGMQDNILSIGNLETTRVVIDVRDTVNAYYMLMINDDSSGKIFNVCGDTPRKMEFFTDTLINISGLDVEKKVSDDLYRPIDIMYQNEMHQINWNNWLETKYSYWKTLSVY